MLVVGVGCPAHRLVVNNRPTLPRDPHLDAQRHSSLLPESRVVEAGCKQFAALSGHCYVLQRQAVGSCGRWVGRMAAQALDKGNGTASSSCALAGARSRSSASCEPEEENVLAGESGRTDCGTGGREGTADSDQPRCRGSLLQGPRRQSWYSAPEQRTAAAASCSSDKDLWQVDPLLPQALGSRPARGSQRARWVQHIHLLVQRLRAGWPTLPAPTAAGRSPPSACQPSLSCPHQP